MAEAQGQRRRAAGRVVRLVATLSILILLLAGGAYTWWNWRPTVPELAEQAGLTGKRELLVGVIGDMPGISLLDETTGEFTGFDVDIALMVAADLGFRADQVRFLVIDNEDRETMRAHDSTGAFVTVDLVVASFSITPEREALPEVSFSEPYLRTELSVVTKKGHPPIQSLNDLRGRPVCTLTTSTAQTPLKEAGADERGKTDISECVEPLLSGEYDAMSTDAAILAGFVQRHPDDLVFHDIGERGQERWGINTGGNEPLRDLVNLSLCKSYHDPNDTRWEEAFANHLRVGIKGQDIAVDSQPEVTAEMMRAVEVRARPGTLPGACN